jgi:endonuclease III
VTHRLKQKYGSPQLGNFDDPIKEIFFILLSARTSEKLYVRAMEKLFSRFPTLDTLAQADAKSVMDCISGAGLGLKRSTLVLELSARLLNDLGDNPQAALRNMSAEEAFQFLTGLPGVGAKSALCVMMWSLNFDVFPVDINVQRIAARLGVLPEGIKHYQAQQQLPRHVPQGLSKDLHTVFMVHGREVCTPGKPKCHNCELTDLCKFAKRHQQRG